MMIKRHFVPVLLLPLFVVGQRRLKGRRILQVLERGGQAAHLQ